MQIGQHQMPVKDVASFTVNNQIYIVSGGWDCVVKFFQVQNNNVQQVGETWVAKPIHYLACNFPLLVTAHSEKWCHVWNLQLCTQGHFAPQAVVESPLKYQTSSIGAFKDGKGFAIGSVEGRCAIMNVNFNQSGEQCVNDFCFKCHRSEDAVKCSGEAFTVNGISFNKLHNTFVTCGSDGTFVTWNKDTKSRYKSSNKAPLPLTSVCFSDDAQVICFAVGEDWSMGAEFAKTRQNAVKIYLRRMDKDEVWKPKKA